MRVIQLNRRTARLLRDNLTGNAEGYDFTDLCRLDWLARKLDELQGPYGEAMAALGREERALRRSLPFNPSTELLAAVNQRLAAMTVEVEDLHEAAADCPVELRLDEGDHKLIADKLAGVTRWMATDEMRPHIIAMVSAVQEAPEVDAEGNAVERPAANGKVKQINSAKRR